VTLYNYKVLPVPYWTDSSLNPTGALEQITIAWNYFGNCT